MQHLTLLKYVLQQGQGQHTLEEQSCFDLWSIIDAVDDEADVNTLFGWFKEVIVDDRVDPHTARVLLQERMERRNPETLSVDGFGCFQGLFVEVNKHAQQNSNNAGDDADDARSTGLSHLVGMEYLWAAAILNPVSEVSNQALQLLQEAYNDVQTSRGGTSKLLLIDDCMKRLNANVTSGILAGLDDLRPQSPAPVTTGSESQALLVPPRDPGPGFAKIQRCLKLIQMYVTANEDEDELAKDFTPHKFMGYGEPLTLTVRIEALYQSAATILIVNTHTHQMISEVREAVAVRMNWQRSRTQLTVAGKLVKSKEDRRVCDFGVVGSCVIQAKVMSVPAYPDIYGEGEYVYSSKGNQPQCPAVLMASKNDYMRRLFELAECQNAAVCEQACTLLDTLPTEPSEMQAYEDSCKKPNLVMLRSLLPLDRLSTYQAGLQTAHSFDPSAPHGRDVGRHGGRVAAGFCRK